MFYQRGCLPWKPHNSHGLVHIILMIDDVILTAYIFSFVYNRWLYFGSHRLMITPHMFLKKVKLNIHTKNEDEVCFTCFHIGKGGEMKDLVNVYVV